MLDEASGDLKEGDTLPGETAFKLYDTFGFPLDLTQDILRGRGMSVDETGFDAAMAKQKEGSKAAGFTSGDAASGEVWFRIRDEVGATAFLGYSDLSADAKIAAIIADGAQTSALKAGDQAELVLDRTPFYAESGGQAGRPWDHRNQAARGSSSAMYKSALAICTHILASWSKVSLKPATR